MNFNPNAELKLHCKSPENRLLPHRLHRTCLRETCSSPTHPVGFPKLSLLVTSFWLETPYKHLLLHQGVSSVSVRPLIPTSPNYQLASVMQHDLSTSLVPSGKSDLKPTLMNGERQSLGKTCRDAVPVRSMSRDGFGK